MLRTVLALLTAWLMAGALATAQAPAGTTPDPRIRVFTFDENRIVPLTGHLGYQMLIEFDPAERIENVAIGDSLGWQVTPNRAATLLFLKPLVKGAATNMTVITSKRRYSFQLNAKDPTGPSDSGLIFAVRFRYLDTPPPPAARAAAPPPAEPQRINVAYSMRGGKRMQGVRVFDDGVATYFQFPDSSDTPAIYLVGADGKEEVVNAQTRGAYTVVDLLAREFVLRVGRVAIRVRNDGWTGPANGGSAP